MCYISLRLRRPIFERRAPAKSNHGRNDHDFNQQSHNVQYCQKERDEINRNSLHRSSAVKRRGHHAALSRKAVEPICYISVCLCRPILERRVPA